MDLSLLENNLFFILFLIASGHSLFLGVLLFSKSIKEKGLVWLGLMLIPVSLLLLTYLFYLTNIMRSHPHLLGVFTPFIYLIGPSYYFFVRKSLRVEEKYKWYDMFHLLPLIYVVWEWWPVYWIPVEDKVAYINMVYMPYKPSFSELLLSNRNTLIVVIYILAAFVLLNKIAAEKGSGKNRVKWLANFTVVFAIIVLLKLLLIMMAWLLNWDGAIFELSMVLLMASAVHFLSYKILGRDIILPELIPDKSTYKYNTSPLTKSQIRQYQDQIADYMRSQKPWLLSTFSSKDLAEALTIPQHYISQVMSMGFQMSFYELCAKHRVELVKQKLLAGETAKYSIQGIATDCGFKSKSGFNRTFKKLTGTTPIDFIRSHKRSNAI